MPQRRTVKKKVKSQAQWEALIRRRLGKLLDIVLGHPSLRKMGPHKTPWYIDCAVVGKQKMTFLNTQFRGKKEPTDVLSFPGAELYFHETSYLGELVVCLPVLLYQAKDLKHSPEHELDVLIIHGILHLLGLDHDKSKSEEKLMSQWEQRLLVEMTGKKTKKQPQALIQRARSGT